MPHLARAFVFFALVAGCAASASDDKVASPSPNARVVADDVVIALAAHDMPRVATFTHPTRGIRFSPYPYVDTTSDRVVPAKEVPSLWQTTSIAHWGSFDGSGEPIDLAYPAYHAKFVYDVDFQHAPRVAVDSPPMGQGNSKNNIADAYRNASVVEYHLPGRDPAMSGMDWRSLWLVFQREQSRWYLVGVVHGAWTI